MYFKGCTIVNLKETVKPIFINEFS